MAEELFISHGPFLTNADVGKITVSFISSVPCAAFVEYRKEGEKEWEKVFQTSGGQVAGGEKKHIFHLKGLVPGAKYTYRAGVFPLFREEETIVKESSFAVFSEERKEYTFLVLADLQFPQEKRDLLMEKYGRLCGAEKCDFIVSLGDMIWGIEDFERDALSGMIDSFQLLGADHIPLVLVRGNHELRGNASWLWNDYFGSPEGNSFTSFRQGAASFLALDSWTDQKGGGENPVFRYNCDEAFLAEEKAFVDRTVKSPAFLSAPFRIVLAHGASHGHIDQFRFLNPNMRFLTDEYFRGKVPAVPIHLWICGHIHHYIRTVPLKRECASIRFPPQPAVTPEEYIFPAITADGPDVAKEIVPPSGIHSSAFLVKVTQEAIEVKAVAEEREGNELIDHFLIRKDHSVEELFPIEHFLWEKDSP